MEDRFKALEANLLSLSDTRLQASTDKFNVDVLEMNQILSVFV
jgi:hypothetical protein